MSFAIVGSTVLGHGTSGTASATIVVSASHDGLLVYVGSQNSSSTQTLSSLTLDGVDITADALLAFTSGAYGSVNYGMGLYYVPNVSAGSHTIQASVSPATNIVVTVAEVTPGLGAVDVASAVTTGTSTTPMTATAITPVASDDVVIGVVNAYGTPGLSSVNSGFTEIGQANYSPDLIWMYQDQTTPTAVAAGCTLNASANWAVFTLAVKYTAPPVVSVVNGTLSAPTQTAPTTSTTGGYYPAGTRYAVITALNAYGETTASNEMSIATTGSTSTITWNWNSVPGATGYNIYVGSSGGENYFYTVGNVTSFVDAGAANSGAASGYPPTTNTTTPTISEGATGIVVTGANFASGMTMTITQGNASVQVPCTYVSPTEATFDLPSSAMEPSSGSQLAFTDATYVTDLAVTVGGLWSTAFQVPIGPPTGLIFQTLENVHPIAAYRVETIPDLNVGDQIEAAGNSAGTTAAPSGLSLYNDGTFVFAAGSTPTNFYVRVYREADQAWSPYELLTITGHGGFVIP